jgi:molybdopterin converting factor small subunit
MDAMTENSIRVKVEIYSWFSGALVPGLNSTLLLEEELPANGTLRTCFNRLVERYPKFSEVVYDPEEDDLHVQVVITHNGLLLTGSGSERLDLVLKNGDSIALIPFYAGG